MKKIILWMMTIFFILFITSLGYAQFGQSSMPSFYGEFKPIIGGWSEYQMTSKDQGAMKMKISIVGKEGEAYWYETVMEGGHEGRNIVKMLVSGDPNDTNHIKKMIVKTGDEPAMEIPITTMRSPTKAREAKGKMVDKGEETIKVPAGTFKTRHIQYQDQEGVVDTWVYRDISPYGLIKSQSKDMVMVLIGYGTNAKSLITETPQRFEMPQTPERPSKRK